MMSNFPFHPTRKDSPFADITLGLYLTLLWLLQRSLETLLKIVECSPKGHKIFISSELWPAPPLSSIVQLFNIFAFTVLHLKRHLINLDYLIQEQSSKFSIQETCAKIVNQTILRFYYFLVPQICQKN